MAVRIPVYRQQTATPSGQVQGGNPMVVRGPDVGGALMDVAQGIGALGRSREQARNEQQEAIGSAYASESLAGIQSEAARELLRLKQEAGEGGAGVVDGINGWIDKRMEEVVGQAPTDTAKKYLRDRLLSYKGTLDLNALEYETAERERWVGSAIDRGTESAAAAVAQFPGMADTILAEQVAAIRANTMLSEPVRRAKIEAATDAITYADVLGDMERDPYAAQRQLRTRLGIAGDATPQQAALQRDSAIEALSMIEADAGRQVPADARQNAVAALMAGGTVSFKPDGTVDVTKGAESGEAAQAGFSYRALSVPKVVELLGRADAEIARRESAQKQEAEFGKVLFAQRLQNITAQMKSGEVAQIPSMEEMNFFLGPERATLAMAELQTYQAMAGELTAMQGMTNAELVASVAQRPEGENNRQFRDMAYSIRADRAAQIIKAREDDPGQYVLTTSKPVAMAYQGYAEELQRVSQMGEQATPADLQNIAKLQSDYIATSNAEQRRLGIRNPKLPKPVVEEIATTFTEGMAGGNPRQAAYLLNSAAMSMIDHPEAIAQVAAKTGDLGAFAVDGVDGLVLQRLKAMTGISEAKRKELLPPGTIWADVEQAVANEFAPLVRSLSVDPNGVKANSRYLRAGEALTAEYLMRNPSLSNTDAARRAYADLFGDANEVVGSYRIPREAGVEEVKAGLATMLATFPASELNVPVEAGMTPDESAARMLRTVQQQGMWVNNQVGDGVILMARGGQTILRADGTPVEVKFSEAAQVGVEAVSRMKYDAFKNSGFGSGTLERPGQ